jgi:hypothetical protein
VLRLCSREREFQLRSPKARVRDEVEKPKHLANVMDVHISYYRTFIRGLKRLFRY